MTKRNSATATSDSSRTRNVEVYDFRRPTTLAREHSRALERAFETFARQWGTQLTAKVRTRSQVTFEQVQMSTYNDYSSGLPSQTSMSLLEVEGLSAKAVIQFPTPAALGWFNRMFGGNGYTVTEDRKYTQIEQALLQKLIEGCVDDLKYSFGPLLAGELSFDSVHHNSQFAQAAGTSELMIVGSFIVQVGESTDPATIAIPAESILQLLGNTNPVVVDSDVRELVNAQTARVPVGVSLQLEPLHVKPAAVLNLSVGDIVRIPHPNHKPMNFAVEGRTIATAAPAAIASRLACRITGTQENHR